MKKIDVTQPYAMSSPFAEGVYSSVSTSDFEIPAETSTAPDDTCVIDDGFLPITSTDLDDGGIAPERKNFNGMFYLSTDQRFYLQNGGFITYNSNVATAIGGYPQDAVLGYIDGQGTYKLVRSLIDDNTNDFTLDETLIDGIHWEEIAMGGGGSGYQLFDIVWKDHILSYDETLGLVQAGSYMYKEAIAGTRYGYPETYQKLIDEYTDVNNTTDTVDSVTVTINANGHKFYDIADKATFDNMYAITGEAYYYGIDTTNERVFMPRLTRTKAGTTSDVGKYNPAGLPNVYAEIYPRTVTTGNSPGTIGGASGMASLTVRGGSADIATMAIGSNNRREDLLVIDASLNSDIYGASSTVEYASTKLIPYFVVGNTADWTGMSTVVNQGMNILSQVANKATTDLDNLTNAGKIAIAHNAMPSQTAVDLTLPATNTIMTAPANGYVCLGKLASSGQNIYLSRKSDSAATADLETSNIAPVNNSHLWAYLPLSKGDKFEVSYTATGQLYKFCFVYANGSESEAS